MEAAGVVTGFTTAKGSTYSVIGQSTKRNKAARSDVGHEGDSGEKESSVKTIYVDQNAANLSAAGRNNVTKPRVIIKDGRARLTSIFNGRRGADSDWIPFYTEP